MSGADLDIIEKCGKTKKTERIKFACFGILLFIPAIVGMFSMMYIVSMFTNNPWFFIPAGIVWFFIVLFIDRSIIATSFKSKVENNSVWSYLVRGIFSVFVGIAVSHPMSLLWFNESILQRIQENTNKAVVERRKQMQTDIKEAPLGSISQMVKEKTDLRDCKTKLLTAEQSGVKVELPCGYSVGKVGCGERCENLRKQIDQLTKEIAKTDVLAGGEISRQANNINTLQTVTDNDIEEIKSGFAKDYLARMSALKEIEKENPQIAIVEWFILLFFLFLDLLIVLIKAVTPRSEYEYVRDTLLYDAKKTQKAERLAIKKHAKETLPKTLEATRKYDSKQNELTRLTDVTRQFLIEQENIRVKFDDEFRLMNQRIVKITDDQLKGYYASYLSNVRKTFNSAWSKASDQFNEFIRGL